MKLFSLLLILVLFASCGPRDDESLLGGGSGGGQGFDLKAGQSLVVDEQDKKLSSCDQESDPTWDTVRLFNELSFMFDKVNNLKVIVGKGPRNCVKVSSKESVEIVLQEAPQSKNFDSSGAFYFVTKIEMLNTRDFLSDPQRLERVASDMAMTVDQLKNFVQAEPRKDQVTLTYLESGDAVKTPPKKSVEFFALPDAQGLTASENCGDKPWTSIRIFPDMQEVIQSSIDNKTLSAIVGSGDRNCLVIGAEAVFSYKNTEGEFIEDLDNKFKVVSVVFRDKADLLEDPILASLVAQQMGYPLEDFSIFLGTINKDRVNVTRIEWVVTP